MLLGSNFTKSSSMFEAPYLLPIPGQRTNPDELETQPREMQFDFVSDEELRLACNGCGAVTSPVLGYCVRDCFSGLTLGVPVQPL